VEEASVSSGINGKTNEKVLLQVKKKSQAVVTEVLAFLHPEKRRIRWQIQR